MKKRILTAFTAAATSATMNFCAFAEAATGGGLQSSVAVTGTTKLLQDLTSALLIIAPIAGTLAIVYFAIRHGSADEMDQKKWKQRMVVAAVCTVIAVLASAIITTLLGYYQQ